MVRGSLTLDQCESWKRYTATRINRSLGTKDRFWQQDGFDHLVRTVEQFEALRRYIAENPAKARLGPDDYRHFTKDLSADSRSSREARPK